MLNPSRIVTSVIAFEGNPCEFRQYLKDHKYEHSVKVERDFVKDTYTLMVRAPAKDVLVFEFLRQAYRQNIYGKWVPLPQRHIHVRIKNIKKHPF